MSPIQIFLLTCLSMLAFAGNSLLCRAALTESTIDATSFTTIRLVSGALILWLIVRLRDSAGAANAADVNGAVTASDTSNSVGVGPGTWLSAVVMFVYAITFSFAYRSLSAATGALLLFGAVQATMIGYGRWKGERFRNTQLTGLVLTLVGIVGLLLPGLSAPPLPGSLLMLCAGAGWGVYSLRGKGAGDPLRVTAGNFIRAAPIAVGLSVLMMNDSTLDLRGFWCASASGALTSGIGYAVWYTALPSLKATTAATVQLSVPVIAALGGIIFFNEPLTMRLVVATITILGGIALVVYDKRQG